MARFKSRREVFAQGGIAVGNEGTKVSELLFGSVSACVPAINASAVGSGSMAITNLDADAVVFLTGTIPDGIVLAAASVTAAGTVSASYVNATGANGAASTITFAYMAFS